MTPTTVDRLTKVLLLERSEGHRNRAVIGGLDAFLAVWLADAGGMVDPELLSAVRDLQGYEGLDPVARAAAVDTVLDVARRTARRGPSSADRSLEGAGPPRLPAADAEPVRRGSSGPSPAAASAASGRPEATAARASGHSPSTAGPEARDARATELDRPVVHLRGVGQKLADRLARLGIVTVRDLLTYAPARYMDFREVLPMAGLRCGVPATVVGTVWEVRSRDIGGGRHLLTVVISDTTAKVPCTFFNQPYLEREFRPGRRIVVSGRPDTWAGRLVLPSPEWEPVDHDLVHTAGLVPVYPLTQGVGQRWLRRLARTTVEEFADAVPDPIPEWLRSKHALSTTPQALRSLHAPRDETDLTEALRRLAFDELLTHLLWSRQQRRAWRSHAGWSLAAGRPAMDQLLAGLPYALTDDQRRAIEDIAANMASSVPMIRLLQGDVGSGKTVVAVAAAVMAMSAGAQVVFMAPTEILVDQHVSSIARLLEPLGYRVLEPGQATVRGSESPGRTIVKLVGSMRKADKAAVVAAVAEGGAGLVVGTHALIQDGVEFRRLGLAVIDEQHRFGVLQRSELLAKGGQFILASLDGAGAAAASDQRADAPKQAEGALRPHLLIMTATPIPRTMAQALHADLDVSVIGQLPPGRKAVATYLMGGLERERAYQYIRHRIREGGQAYVVVPLVEASEDSAAPAAVEEHQRLAREVFPDLRLDLLHGRMSGEEKESAMARFRAGQTQVLVATSVIEVGVDVPNANVIFVDWADRFGLAQLHQLRGRVGRGSRESACLLLAEDPSDAARERLEAMARTGDGLALAEMDLAARGPGDYFGVRQSGMVDSFRFARRVGSQVVADAQRAADELLERDPTMETLEMRLLAAAVSSYGEAKEPA